MKSDRNFEFPLMDTVVSTAVIGALATLILSVVFSPDLLRVLA